MAPLSYLFESSFEYSYLPPIWLKSIVTPIFKKGKHTDPANYRPVALTSILCKLMETIIKNQLNSYLFLNNFLSQHQHGFISKLSTATNLLECTNDWLLSLNSSKSTDAVYIDFSKAFDSIVLSKLLYKLKNYGISGNLFKWISGFINNRTQVVKVDNCHSSPRPVLSGVPQGSVLGPVLFILFINDITSVCEGSTIIKLFADDAKLFTVVTVNDYSLQHSLDNLTIWAADWQLTINIIKCCILSIRNHSSVNNAHPCYFINGVALTCSDSVSDLGILVTNDLNFKTHICSIVTKALYRSSVIFRAFTCRDLNLLRRAFITYVNVRPLVEYNSILWNPTTVYLIDLLESVQRKYTKRIPSLSDQSYAERSD